MKPTPEEPAPPFTVEHALPVRASHSLQQMRPDVRARLVAGLRKNRTAICDRWVEALRASGSPHYAQLPDGQIKASITSLFNGYLAFLETGTPEPLGQQVANVANRRLREGFPLVDLEVAVGAVRVSILPAIIEMFSAEPDLLAEAVAALMTAEELASVCIAHTFQQNASQDLQAAQAEALQAEHDKVVFCREMARVATHEKLILCDHEDLLEHEGADVLEINDPRDVRKARQMAVAVANRLGWNDDRTYSLQLCIGEAGTNAVRHAGAATFQVWSEGDEVTFRLADKGPGIDFCRIPVSLQAGYSTGSSLGMGFTLMLELADCIHLATDHHGTTLEILLKPRA